MIIGILKERFESEQRVALSPFGVEALVQAGAQVVIEREAGASARFSDDQYREAGGSVVYSAEEAAGRADVLVKVMPPMESEFELLHEGQTLLSFLLLGMSKRPFIDHLMAHSMTGVGMELLRGKGGSYPILRIMSEISGQIAAMVSGRWLRSDQGGRGVLLGGVPGVAPAAVVILGVGASGFAAAQACLGLGAQVIVLDNDLERLRRAEQALGKRITTVIASPENIRRGVKLADVFIGAISITDDESHHIVTEEMVKTMKAGAVIIDIAINQGGCVETIRPTTIKDPVYEMHGVLHYAVPNMPSMVARSATYALTNALLPVLRTLISAGVEKAIEDDPYFRCGVVTHRGMPTHKLLHDLYDIDVEPFDCNC
ncbi:MAG: alanine dehydrogenase [Ignavibacteria bacterium]|nr:alanine dehydrogenase [Ignavibacteria bacterium]